jgi:hypothetical protein
MIAFELGERQVTATGATVPLTIKTDELPTEVW